MREPPSAVYEGSLQIFSGNSNPQLADGIAQHLGIDVGRALISRFAASRPPQWNGANSVSGRMSAVTSAANSTFPRRLSTVTRLPYATTPCGIDWIL